MSHPYLSFVIPTRNDNYPNVVAAQQKCLSVLHHQLEEAQVVSEIIVVEYNPDPSQPHLHETLRLDQGRYVTVKVISVDPEFHRRFQYAGALPFHQSCAVNIGLRRSRGRFFVYRAVDHIYSDALIRFLGKKTLLEDCIYRCDRVDIHKSVLDFVETDRLGDISGVCQDHIVEWHKPLHVPSYYYIPTLHSNGCGDFLLMSRASWLTVAGLREGRVPFFLDYDSLVLYASRARGNYEAVLPDDCRVYKITHGMKTVSRRQPVWTSRCKTLDEFWQRNANNAVANWSRAIFNYPRRRDRAFEQVLLDSYERNFLLRAQLWSHGFPFVRQNYGRWGLDGENLSEHVLVSGTWDVRKSPDGAVSETQQGFQIAR